MSQRGTSGAPVVVGLPPGQFGSCGVVVSVHVVGPVRDPTGAGVVPASARGPGASVAAQPAKHTARMPAAKGIENCRNIADAS